MPQLYKTRTGWENENLARYILSKFSFVAEPVSVSDDIGVDFFCTTFHKVKKNKSDLLFPKSAFAIQVKSNKDAFDVSNKIEYFLNLEIPFFVGVISSAEQKLTIYSGDYLPRFFSHVGEPEKLKIKLVEKREDLNAKPRQKEYTIPFSKVCEIQASTDLNGLEPLVDKINEICKLTQKNNSSKISGECIFQDYETNLINIIAGGGSAKIFKDNFLKSLTAVFFNLKWIAGQSKDYYRRDQLIESIKLYKKLYYEIKEVYRELPGYLNSSFKEFEEATKGILK